MQSENGGFSSWNTENVESISQVVVALCSLGIDPLKDERFITSSGKTILDAMLSFHLSSGGFCHVKGTGWNSMANDQATYALVAYWRFENKMNPLYDMRDEQAQEGNPDASESLIKEKEEAIKLIETYKNINDYRSEQKEEINKIIAEGKIAITSAETSDEVFKAVTLIKAKLDSVKTNKQLTDAENAKNNGNSGNSGNSGSSEDLENNENNSSKNENSQENISSSNFLSPKTADSSNLILYLGLMVISVMFITVQICFINKKNKC